MRWFSCYISIDTKKNLYKLPTHYKNYENSDAKASKITTKKVTTKLIFENKNHVVSIDIKFYFQEIVPEITRCNKHKFILIFAPLYYKWSFYIISSDIRGDQIPVYRESKDAINKKPIPF